LFIITRSFTKKHEVTRRSEIWNLESGIINTYFPLLTTAQAAQFEQLGPLYTEWNAMINVISRKDIENLYERHVLHSLGIAKLIHFKPGTRILDAGTGGGFPGIPLAILFPDVHFHLVDSTAKKLTVVQAIASETGLKNITTEHCRLEDHKGRYDFVVSRAVTTLDEMIRWIWENISKACFNDLPNGILYLKGGDLNEEIMKIIPGGEAEARKINYNIYHLHDYFSEPFFDTKSIVHLF